MLIDYITQKNNFITVSDFLTFSEDISDKDSGIFSVKNNLKWTSNSLYKYIKLNVLEQSPLASITFTATNYNSYTIETSYDNLNWKLISSGVYIEDTFSESFTNEDFIYLRISFDASSGINDATSFSDFTVYGNQEITINKEYISTVSSLFYPQSYFETNPLIPEFVGKFFEMLEYNDKYDIQYMVPWNLKMFVTYVLTVEDESEYRIEFFRTLKILVDGVYVNYDETIHQDLGDYSFIWNFGDSINSTEINPNIIVKRDFNYGTSVSHIYSVASDNHYYSGNLTFKNQYFSFEVPIKLDFYEEGGIGTSPIGNYFEIQ